MTELSVNYKHRVIAMIAMGIAKARQKKVSDSDNNSNKRRRIDNNEEIELSQYYSQPDSNDKKSSNQHILAIPFNIITNMENPEVENAEIVKQFYDSYRQLCSDERQSFYEYVQSKFEVRIKQFSDKSFARFVHGYSFLTLISKNTGGGASPDGCTDKTDSNACQNAIGWNSTGISEEIIDELTNRIHFYQYMIWVLLVSVVKATSEQADIENIPDRAISRSLTLLKLFRQSTIELIDTSAKVISMIVVMTENSTMASKSSKGKDEDNLWSPLTASRSEGSANYVSNVRHGFSTQTSVGAAVNSVASEDGKRTEFFRDHILQKAVELKDSIEDWALQIIAKSFDKFEDWPLLTTELLETISDMEELEY